MSRKASATAARSGARRKPLAQESGQRQQPVAPALAGCGADGPAGLRRDIDEVLRFARHRAFGEVEREAAFAEQAGLEQSNQRRREVGIVERVEDEGQRLVERLRADRARAAGAAARRDSRGRRAPARSAE